VKTSLSGLLRSIPLSGFRLYLQSELARRCAANPQYSLRSFALQLNINHSTLSQLLRGKRMLTPHTIAALGERLGLSSIEIEGFVTRERQTGSTAVSRAIRVLTLDTLALLSDNSHRAILELMALLEFVPDSRWIARTLGLSVDEVNQALSRLIRLGLLEMVEPTCWVDRSKASSVSQDGFAQLVINRLSEQVRRLSATPALEPPEELLEPAVLSLVVSATQLAALTDWLKQCQGADISVSETQQYQLEIHLKPLNSTLSNQEV
jgi:hypothetical protein